MPPTSRLRRLPPVLVGLAVLAVALVALVAVRAPAGAEATGLAVPPTPVPPTFPTATGPAPGPTPTPVAPVCSPQGLSVTAGEVDAALGHRAVVLTVTNCGSHPREVTGYADVAVLDATGAPMPFTVVHDSTYTVRDPGPSPLVLQPGEAAVTGVSWSATVTSGGLTEGQALRVVPVAGDVAQVLPVWVDAGTTGEIAVAAWATELAQ